MMINPTKPNFLYLVWGILFVINIAMIFRVMPEAENRILSASDTPEKVELLDVEVFGFDEEKVHQIMTALGPEGRKQYIRFHRHDDFIFPFSYAIFLSITLFLLAGKRFRNKIQVIIASAIPLFAMLADFIENHFITLICKQYPDIETGIIQTASLANSAKSLFLIITFGLAILLLIGNAIQRLKRFRKPWFS